MAGTSKQTIGQKDDEDCISLLPDSLIHHIFSYLRTRDVVKTCVLSKRWQPLWTTVSDLRFSVPSSHDDLFVDRVLTLYASGKVKKFHLHITSKLCTPSKIDTWVGFAIDHQVEELHLELLSGANPMLPPLFYNCSSLTKLCLSGCRFSPSESISWGSLTSLSIEFATVSDDVLRKILMGSPVLEHLSLIGCIGIYSTSLGELGIDSTVAASPLCDSTPRLRSLRVSGCYLHGIVRMVEAPFLIEAELNLHSSPKSDWRFLKETLCKLGNATRILLGPWWVEVTWPVKVEDVQVSLPNCKTLTLDLLFHEFSFPAIGNMLATTPNLEKLVIILRQYKRFLGCLMKSRSQVKIFEIGMYHLKSLPSFVSLSPSSRETSIMIWKFQGWGNLCFKCSLLSKLHISLVDSYFSSLSECRCDDDDYKIELAFMNSDSSFMISSDLVTTG